MFSLLFLALLNFRSASILVKPPLKHSWGINKGGERELRLFLGSDASFDEPLGLSVVRLKRWDDPSTDADDDEVVVYGVNSGRGEIIFNSSMKSLGVWRGIGEEKLDNPGGITADGDGRVYIADAGNRRIVKLVNSGSELLFISAFGEESLVVPCDVALDSRGKVYVADSAKSAVFLFDSTGNFIKRLAFKELTAPTAIAVTDQYEPWTYIPQNIVVVVDSARSRITAYNFKGEMLGRISGEVLGIDRVAFLFVALDYHNNIYVTDSLSCMVHKFDSRLRYLASFEDDFISPRGIAIYRKFGQCFIAERKSARYYWIATEILDLNCSFDDNRLRIAFFLPEPSFIYLKLGRKEILSERRFNSGERNITIPVNDGYSEKMTITAEATYSSRGHYKSKKSCKIRKRKE